MKKRTKQLQDAEQIALPAYGRDVFMERGDYELTAAEKEEVAANLAKEGPYRTKVQELVEKILTFQGAFIEGFYSNLPKEECAKLNFKFDGPKLAARLGDRVLAVYDPKIPRDYEAGVMQTLLAMRSAAAFGGDAA